MNKLPELPEGYYFEVFEYIDSIGYDPAEYAIAIVRKRKWCSDKREAFVTFSESNPEAWTLSNALRAQPLTDENVLNYATKCYEQWQNNNARNQTEERLLGKYPPKKLEL